MSKGQVLPIFVILLPIIFIMLFYVVDVGLMYTEKRKIVNNTKDAINYYFDTNNRDNTIELLEKNIKGATIDIDIDSEYITINVIKKHNSIYNMINLNNEINITYKGNLETKRIVKG